MTTDRWERELSTSFVLEMGEELAQNYISIVPKFDAMVISTESVWEEVIDEFMREYQDAVVYAEFEQETVLHEGSLRVLPNGWVELPTGRLLSPEAVHHIDT